MKGDLLSLNLEPFISSSSAQFLPLPHFIHLFLLIITTNMIEKGENPLLALNTMQEISSSVYLSHSGKVISSDLLFRTLISKYFSECYLHVGTGPNAKD